MRTVFVAMLAVHVALAGCVGDAVDDDRPLIIATTSIVGDLAMQVAADKAQVEVLIPVGADPHDFAPSARQAAHLREADLLVTSGLGLEAGLADTLEAAAEEGARILELGEMLDPRPLGGGEAGAPDPHWWLDPQRAARAVGLIADHMRQIAEGGWADRAASAAARLEAIDEEVRSTLGRIPHERRTLVTGHDAFEYFAERYDFEIIGILVPGGATQAQPDPRALAELAAVIRATGQPAIFADTTLPSNVAEALAAEVGGDVQVVMLFTGSLGEPGSGAETYIDMLQTNADRIAAALD